MVKVQSTEFNGHLSCQIYTRRISKQRSILAEERETFMLRIRLERKYTGCPATTTTSSKAICSTTTVLLLLDTS